MAAPGRGPSLRALRVNEGWFRAMGLQGGGVDESSTSRDAGATEFAEDFFVSVGGVQQAGGAVKEGDEGKGERRVAIWSTA